MIIYFSGTGNSRYVAKYISECIHDEVLIDSGKMIKNNEIGKFQKADKYVFVCPTYSWGIPKIFEKFIRESKLCDGSKAYFVMTCGANIGNAGDKLKKICSDKNLQYMGVSPIVMPENYIAMFPVPEGDVAKKIVKAAGDSIKKASYCVADGKSLGEHREGFLGWAQTHTINPTFYKLFVSAKKFYVRDGCISCGKCVQLCPLNNIKLVHGKPVWGKDCTHCMACICGCPTEAIEYGKKSNGNNRYNCIEFNKDDMKK